MTRCRFGRNQRPDMDGLCFLLRPLLFAGVASSDHVFRKAEESMREYALARYSIILFIEENLGSEETYRCVIVFPFYFLRMQNGVRNELVSMDFF